MSNSHTTQRGVYDIGTATTEREEQRPFPSRVNRYRPCVHSAAKRERSGTDQYNDSYFFPCGP
jgi:hypothetical protein